jgi:2-(1,2-epoxy-1,2-dihydrophenyl)acetyl-CoA isomerase
MECPHVPDLLTERTEAGVLLITLNRPDMLNTVTLEMRELFRAAIDEATRDARVRVVAITGAGRAFCGGADLAAADRANQAGASSYGAGAEEAPRQGGILGGTSDMQVFHRQFAGALYDCPKPTVALVNGAAAGGGMGMCLAADFRIASEEAFFVSAFARIALAGDNGITYGLQRLVGRSKALEILMLSPRIRAAEALELGIVREVVPADALLSAGLEFCDRLAAGPTTIFSLMKAHMAFAENATYHESLDREAAGIAIAGTTSESREAISAFLQKRPPQFS